MKNKDVTRLFMCGQEANTLHLHSTGDKLFSYHTCIAQHCGEDIIGNATKYSSTTSHHLRYIRGYITIWTTKQVPYNTQSLIPYL